MITTRIYYTPIQLKLPVEIEKKIEITDPVYSFSEVMWHIDLNKYFVNKESKTGRSRYDRTKLLKIILFAFMEEGYPALRRIEKLCKTDIRFMYLLDEMPVPSYATLCNFINDELCTAIENIFDEINSYIFTSENVDLKHVYIDGTKIEANANKYTWVWKKSCLKSRNREFSKITSYIEKINEDILFCFKVKIGIREEYAAEYIDQIMKTLLTQTGVSEESFVYGKGKRKSDVQRYYDLLSESLDKLKRYGTSIEICGDKRNSYSKTDHDATFMRVKRDYMGNDQLLPAYNVQMAVCDEYIASYGVYRYASDMDCFQPLMERFYAKYGSYPEYPVADAGYGSLNNYLYCEEHGMKKFMKFTMFDKETKDKKYREDPYRAVNFKIENDGSMICPKGRKFSFVKSGHIKGNNYGRTEEYYRCESCENCEHRSKCHKSANDRIVRVNRELTRIHEEVLENLNSIHGAYLRMNRSIQSEGTFGEIKANRGYKRFRRRGEVSVLLEIALISCGFNLHKFHLKKISLAAAG